MQKHLRLLRVYDSDYTFSMAKAAKNDNTFNNDWQALTAKPELTNKKQNTEDLPEPYVAKREDTYYGLHPSDSGEKYSFAVIPAANGSSVLMTDVATIKRHRFTSPKDGKHYFENLKLPMDPAQLFDMSIMSKLDDPNSITDSDKVILNRIKRHQNLIQRYKDLQYCKEEGVNFGYSTKPNLYSSRLKKVSLTGFFGLWTQWKGKKNEHKDRKVKFIYSGYAAFQDKFRDLIKTMGESHERLQPTWWEDYFSMNSGEVKGLLNIKMGSMKVGGSGATINLIKVGKDPIEDDGAGMTGPIKKTEVEILPGEDNVLSHLHYFMGMKSNEDLWQDVYIDKFEMALIQLENHVKETALRNLDNKQGKTDSSPETPKVEAPTSNVDASAPF